jgi:hypothetical protein
MMATVPHVTSGLGLRKFQADGFFSTECTFCLFSFNMKVSGVQAYDISGFNDRPKEFPSKTFTKNNKIKNSSVSIVTAYGRDGPEIESRWRRDFPHLSRPALRPTQPPVYIIRVFPGGKVRPGRDADPSPPSSAEIKNRVELYLYSP